MSKLTKFANKAIDLKETNHVKGGVFCDVYLGHCAEEGKTPNAWVMDRAMDLDRIESEHGMGAAMFWGGGIFMAIYG